MTAEVIPCPALQTVPQDTGERPIRIREMMREEWEQIARKARLEDPEWTEADHTQSWIDWCLSCRPRRNVEVPCG
jgi:hypothetical protein